MLTIILKIILCSSIFIAVYYFALEKEKMYRFNRFYLLGSLILSYVIPFITISVRIPETEAKPQIIIEEATQQIAFIQPEQESFNWMYVLWGIYAAITLFLLIKSILAVLSIRQLQGKKQIYHHYNILLTQKDLPPFSFWNTIYMGKNYAKNDIIDPRIFLHEKSHLDQKHSTDLIIIDILKIFTWFNPLIFLYKKAVVTNHEFLADESVLSEEVNIKEYQNLILDELLAHQSPPLTHSFNFNNTKKRFIMMKAKKTKFSPLRKIVGITAVAAAAVLFSERTYAADTALSNTTSEPVRNIAATTSAEDPYGEFKDILSKYSDLLNHKKYAEFSKKITDSDKKRLEELYPLLTETQRNSQKIVFFNAPESKKRIPTVNELQSFLNKNEYAVWIDSKKIDNSVLKDYKSSDFSNVYISKVYQNARTAKNPQPYQVSLMTHSHYEKAQQEKQKTLMGFKKESLKAVSDTITPRKAEANEGKNTNITTQSNIDYTEAQFPDGLSGLRRLIGKKMDVSAIEPLRGSITSMAYIHIDEKGKATDVTTSGNNEIFNKEFLRTITDINNETTWKPAIKDGKAIASVLKVPATMTFARP